MRRLLPVLFISFLILSCTNPRQINAELKQADCLMLHHPDSSLLILQGIKKANLKTSSQRAYYSLLISQALDRNSIYITSDSLIAPAVNYYEDHGNAKQKLRTCYYMAAIANNAGDTSEAMEWLAQGESLIPQANDVFTAAHLYSLKSRIYKDQYAYEAALENDIQSRDYYLRNQFPIRYAYSQVSVADDYLHLNDLNSANQELDVLVPYWDSLAVNIRSQYLETRINIAIEAQDTAYVMALKDSCFSQVPTSRQRPWIAIADAYNTCGQLDSALYILENYAIYKPDLLDRDYYLRMSSIYEKQGDYQKALDMRNKVAAAVQSHMYSVLNSDTRFTEERYKLQIQDLRQKNLRNSVIATLAVFLLLSSIAFGYARKAWKQSKSELSSLKLQYNDLLKERNALFEAQEKSEVMNDEINKIIKERLALLDKVLLGYITTNPTDVKAANESIKDVLRNKDVFILNTATVFSTSHPLFVKFLKDHDLDQWEIGYCCLFLMGMYSKDMEPHFSKASSNKFNSIIRNKLGLPLNGPKLKTYLLETCKKLEA